MRFAVDTGGTFTDLVIEHDDGSYQLFKRSTTPTDPLVGIVDVFQAAADALGMSLHDLLAGASTLIHGTTRAINAIITGSTARTAFLTTEGHPDVLLFREGGRRQPSNNARWYPDPYVPRSLTFEVPERVLVDGTIATQLDETRTREIIAGLKERNVEAVAVCLLWSISNPVHEQRLGQLLEELLPDVPHTLSHDLNPTIREYRRACSTSIDASLKPTMTSYFDRFADRLRELGFPGRLLIISSTGGVLDASAVARAPIHAVNSGPAMAPVAGKGFARIHNEHDTAIVVDAGGTTFDVSVVLDGRIPQTRETWIGEPHDGDLTGFPSVDVRSIGAGGGTLAWVDSGRLLRFGPASAGAEPGPACYGRGGERPTLTDACLVSGYLDPAAFLDGSMSLDVDAAKRAIEREVAEPLGLDLVQASGAIITLATEQMTRAIESVTIEQALDPRSAVIVAGGGAAGFNIVAIGRQLGVQRIIVPVTSSALSAAGALMSDLIAEYSESLFTTTARFDFDGVASLIDRLRARCERFVHEAGAESDSSTLELIVEARYPHQVWELDLPLPGHEVSDAADVESLRQAFHELHEKTFATVDPDSAVEILTWRARVSCVLKKAAPSGSMPVTNGRPRTRQAFFVGHGEVTARVVKLEEIAAADRLIGPAFVEMPLTTVTVDPGAIATRADSGALVVHPSPAS